MLRQRTIFLIELTCLSLNSSNHFTHPLFEELYFDNQTEVDQADRVQEPESAKVSTEVLIRN